MSQLDTPGTHHILLADAHIAHPRAFHQDARGWLIAAASPGGLNEPQFDSAPW
ncbi:hypothetical protein [Nocardia pneumoniae]|uniref:hypothetical protein n=1 Tax=Nocardia pneumoniae TaxID=228601 RepID=UPI0002E07C6E|nr:hypothetical protein [Nocardia pneumoniae]